jgi:ornithine carbamoyltransferase
MCCSIAISSSATAVPPAVSAWARGNAGDLDVLLGQAQAIGRARRGERDCSGLLRGRNVGLLCGGEPGEAAALFTRAATALGARVSRLSGDLAAPGGRDERAIARVLGRLYDAIECQAVPTETIARLRGAAGVPVYDGLATASHPTAALVPMLGLPPDEARELVVQASLVAAFDGA